LFRDLVGAASAALEMPDTARPAKQPKYPEIRTITGSLYGTDYQTETTVFQLLQ
jgi:hypothetical protein